MWRHGFDSRSELLAFSVDKVTKEQIFNQILLYYNVSTILSTIHEFGRRLLSSKIRIQLQNCTSEFVVDKLALWHVPFRVLR